MDQHYLHHPAPGQGIEHDYGPQVHILSQPYPMSLLTRLCSPETTQPAVGRLVSRLYDWMLGEVSGRILDRRQVSVPTRMRASEPRGVYKGEAIDRRQPVVVVDVARAGMVPSLRVYDGLHDLLDPDVIRQDHVMASRRTNEHGQVIGIEVHASKIGGPVADATVVFPDPMAATGTSLDAVLRTYKTLDGGPPRRIVALHLIVTPEYLRRITRAHPELQIYAVRLDRGLSSPEVLATRPGSRWDEEVGLNAVQYIVPGAGGVGELMNNSWV